MAGHCEFVTTSKLEDLSEKINYWGRRCHRVTFANFKWNNVVMEYGKESWLYRIVNTSSENFMDEVNGFMREGFTIRDALLEGTRIFLMERKIS